MQNKDIIAISKKLVKLYSELDIIMESITKREGLTSEDRSVMKKVSRRLYYEKLEEKGYIHKKKLEKGE